MSPLCQRNDVARGRLQRRSLSLGTAKQPAWLRELIIIESDFICLGLGHVQSECAARLSSRDFHYRIPPKPNRLIDLAIDGLVDEYGAHPPNDFRVQLDRDYQNRKNAMPVRSKTDARKATVFRQMWPEPYWQPFERLA